MESFRPQKTDPIPLRTSPQRMGTIMIRFCGLLAIAVVVLAALVAALVVLRRRRPSAGATPPMQAWQEGPAPRRSSL